MSADERLRVDERHLATLERMIEMTVLLNGDMTRRLERDGLTPSRAGVLWQLGHRGPTTQRTLADALGVSARTVTGLVDGLEATGFVTREPHPTDRRATLVTPTRQGTRVLTAMREEQHEMARLLFGDLPAKRFDCFAGGLDHVVDRIRAGLAAQEGVT